MKKLLLISFFVAFINGCASTPTNQKAAPQAPSQYQFSEFKEGEALYKKKKYPLAISKLASFLKKYPKTEVSDNAAFYLAAMHYENGEQKVAVQYWLEIVNSDTASELSDIATLRAAQTLVQIGKTTEALNVVSRFKAQPTTDKATQQQILELSARLKASHGMSFEAAKDFYAASKLVDQQVEKQALINKAGEIIGANLQPEQLEKIVSDPELSLFEPLVRYRLGLIEFERKNWGGARAQFGILVSKFSGTEYARRGQQYVDLIDARETADGNTIGVILPLSGRYSPAGQKALKAIQMAFGIYGKNSTGVKLAVMDSEGNSEVAQKAIERLVTEDHVAAVIGDITSKTAQAVAQRAQELGVLGRPT
jgi:outer membrane protein assembly factor BamD (BamD/ComL family)